MPIPSKYRRHTRRFSLKRLVPSDLFGRALLILVLPMLLSQLLMAYVFFERHWSSVERNLANSEVGDLAWLYNTYTDAYDLEGADAALQQTRALGRQLNVQVTFDEARRVEGGKGKRLFPDLYRALAPRVEVPMALVAEEGSSLVHVRLGVAEGALDFAIPRKALTSPTTTIFILWMVGSAVLLTAIATLFLRNQVKPIVALARAAEQLGLGQDVTGFRPRGASEVRRAGRAFLVMAERIRRHVQNRTEMLAGISHDLRTPLTRMTLELELASMDAATRSALQGDIEDMRSMIDEYLDFARGDAGELAEPIDLSVLLADLAADYQRSKRAVHFTPGGAVVVMLRPQALRRALTNVIDNALRYGGGSATLAVEQSVTFVRIKITDQGPGIAESDHETVFKPFTRLEPSRNAQTGGVGLGLSIARAVAQSHGGDITLENQREAQGTITGLEVTLRLPRAVQTAVG